MRPINSAYDRYTAEFRSNDNGAGIYALISVHNGPCSLVGEFADLDEAIGAARNMDTDSAPAEFEGEIGYDGSGDCDDSGLIAAAKAAGWSVAASAPAGEYWTVMVKGAMTDSKIQAPDTQPGEYYVSCRNGSRYALLLGPFTNDHAGALAMVDKVTEKAHQLDGRAAFYSFGTCRLPADDTLPIRAGKLNEFFGLPTGKASQKTAERI